MDALCWMKGPRLFMEAQDSFEEGATFVHDDGKLFIVVAEEKAMDSYNQSFQCQLTATPEQARQLRDWLIVQFPADTPIRAER